MNAEGSLVFSEVSSEKHSLNTSLYDKASNEAEQINSPSKRYLLEVKKSYPSQRLMDLSVLLCCEDALYLYSLKLLVQVPPPFFVKPFHFFLFRKLKWCLIGNL